MLIVNINLYINCVYYSFYPSAVVSMETQLSLSYNMGVSGNGYLSLHYYNCFDKSFTEMFYWGLCSNNDMNFAKVTRFD